MTPQTLINDLEKENCDAQDIVLLVIGKYPYALGHIVLNIRLDEAHRGTGEYAYTRIVRFMQSKNPHFRILALTATPGGNPDAVQTLVDNLHISHIEIRDETSLDLRPYAHEKVTVCLEKTALSLTILFRISANISSRRTKRSTR